MYFYSNRHKLSRYIENNIMVENNIKFHGNRTHTVNIKEKCIFYGENAWISENQEGFALENALNFRIYI